MGQLFCRASTAEDIDRAEFSSVENVILKLNGK